MTATVTAHAPPKVLYTSSDADRQGGALRCLFDMGDEIGNWGYRPMLVLSDEQAGSTPADGNRSVRTYSLPLPRPKRGQIDRQLSPRRR